MLSEQTEKQEALTKEWDLLFPTEGVSRHHPRVTNSRDLAGILDAGTTAGINLFFQVAGQSNNKISLL